MGKSAREMSMEEGWAQNAEENAEILKAHPEWFKKNWVPGTGNPSYGMSIQECFERDALSKMQLRPKRKV